MELKNAEENGEDEISDDRGITKNRRRPLS